MLRATVEKDGSVSRVKALTGNPQLAAAAIEAVRQWRYPPMKKAAKTNMTLFFGLPKAGSPDDYVEPPIAIYKPDPSFLTDGDMWLAVTVEVDGTVSNVNVLNSLGNEVDEKVIQTVQTWTFLPAVKAGKPVPFTIKVEVSFKRQ
jgi:TonB family protein